MAAKWDWARDEMRCVRRGCVIGQGEAYRVGKTGAWCEDCSEALDGETVPEHLASRGFLERLRDDIAQHAPADTEPVFSTFDRAGMRQELWNRVQQANSAKPSASRLTAASHRRPR